MLYCVGSPLLWECCSLWECEMIYFDSLLGAADYCGQSDWRYLQFTVWVYTVGACCRQLIRLVGMVLVGFYFFIFRFGVFSFTVVDY